MTAAAHISLIGCTRNRAEPLKRCLAAIAHADADQIPSELLVVDNGSTDHTEEIVRSFAAQAPLPVRCVQQPRIGLSNARNAGMAQARSDILAFTDDDCYIASNYFSALKQAYASAAL